MARPGDRGEGAHAQLVELLGAERLGGDVVGLGRDLRSAPGKALRRQLVRRRVREVARAVRPLGDPGRALRRLGYPSGVAAGQEGDALDRAGRDAVRLPPPGVVRAEHGSLHDRPGLLELGERERRVEHPGDRAPDPLGGARDGRCGGPERVRVGVSGGADSCGGEPGGRAGGLEVHEHGLSDLAADLAVREELAKVLVETRVEVGSEGAIVLRNRDGDDVGVDLAGRDDADLDSHRGAMVADRLSVGRHPER